MLLTDPIKEKKNSRRLVENTSKSLLEEVIERTLLLIDPGAGPVQSEAPHPLPCLAMCILPTVPRVGAVFKDAALREQCVFETI